MSTAAVVSSERAHATLNGEVCVQGLCVAAPGPFPGPLGWREASLKEAVPWGRDAAGSAARLRGENLVSRGDDLSGRPL